jgi:hypothetical protein
MHRSRVPRDAPRSRSLLRHQRAQHRPANLGFSGAEGAIRALVRALRLCRSSRPRLERGGRRTTASRQSRHRKLQTASDGSGRKPRRTSAILGLSAESRRARVWRTARWTRPRSWRPSDGKLIEETVELTTARPVSVMAVMATYPSPRATDAPTLGQVAGSPWKSPQFGRDPKAWSPPTKSKVCGFASAVENSLQIDRFLTSLKLT